MVDPIGIRTGAVASQRTVSVVATQAAAAPKAVQTSTDAKPVETEAAELAVTMASGAPVDGDRVARIRKAVEEGRFPLVPSTVADRLLAIKMQWDPNDAP